MPCASTILPCSTPQSWHALAGAGHHTLQLPWARSCRRLPADLRAELRRMSWAVGSHVPSVLGVGEDVRDTRRARLRDLPGELLASELTQSKNRMAAAMAHCR